MRFPSRAHSVVMSLALAVVAPSLARAAGPRAALGERVRARQAQDPALAEERRAKILDAIETVRVARMTEALNLDSETAQKLFPAIQPFSQRRKDALRVRTETMRDLKKQFDSGSPDPNAVAPLLDRMADNEKELCDIRQGEYQALKKVLDPVTLAKYYQFNLQFERQIGQILRQVRQGNAEGAGRFKRPFGPLSGPNGGDAPAPQESGNDPSE